MKPPRRLEVRFGQLVTVTGSGPGEWDWANIKLDSTPATMTITSTGLYTVNLWMREDGLRIDRLLLTTDTTFVPTGEGPAESQQIGPGVPPPSTSLARTIVYTYDNLYRLTDADYSTGDLYEYEYDAVGNRLKQIINGDTTDYLYDAANRLEKLDGQSVYDFDDNGNLLSSDTLTNTWDAANRLTEIVNPKSQIQNRYNGVNDRVAQVTDGVTTTFALDVLGLPEVIYTSDGNAYLHLPGVIVAESSTGETRYLLSDGLGSIRHATDENAQVVVYNEFDPYGNPVEIGSELYGYTGEWWVSYIELLHLRARWYSPSTGTFLSRDLFPGFSQSPQSMNGWSYVTGNPVNLSDPSGKFPPLPDPPPRTPYGQPEENVCETWPNSGYFRNLCDRAYRGDLDAMERIFRHIAQAETLIPQLHFAGRMLDHFLDGSGEEQQLWAFWYREQLPIKIEINKLKQDVIDEIEKLRDNCQCNTPPEIPIQEKTEGINVDATGYLPSGVQNVFGQHTLNVDAYPNLNANCIGWITHEFYVYEYYDFGKYSATFEIPVPGWTPPGWSVPAAWADFLKDASRAEFFWTTVRWTDRDLHWNPK